MRPVIEGWDSDTDLFFSTFNFNAEFLSPRSVPDEVANLR
jgi:hypothetical protein